MTEGERLVAITSINDWRRADSDIALIADVVCRHHKQPSVGHLARFFPEEFDELFEELEAMIGG